MARKRNTTNFASDLGLAGMHSAVTLWYRLPMMANAFATGDHSGAEMTRMVSEKFSAIFQGALDAQVETMRLVGAAATGRLRMEDMAGASVSIAAAGLRPAMRTVKANSRRLSRKR